jgi:molybdenum cofactor guanylyltransferase
MSLTCDVLPSPSASDSGGLNDVPDFPKTEITGVILAGGRGRRVGGQDKGLLPVHGRPLVSHIIDALRPQVGSLLLSANRNLGSYRAFGLPVVTDILGEYLGPLAGMASTMQGMNTPYLLTVPCDSPLVPLDLCTRLYHDLTTTTADLSVAHDGDRMQPVFALLRRPLLPDLLDYLENGGRKIETWYRAHRLVLSDFSDRPNSFLNINRSEELDALETTR